MVADVLTRWQGRLEQEAVAAIDTGNLPTHASAIWTAFELNAVAMGANQSL